MSDSSPVKPGKRHLATCKNKQKWPRLSGGHRSRCWSKAKQRPELRLSDTRREHTSEDTSSTPAALAFERRPVLRGPQDRGGFQGCPTTLPSIPECRRTRRVRRGTGGSGSWSLPRCCSPGAPTERAMSPGGSTPPSAPAWAPLEPNRALAERGHPRRPLAPPACSGGHRRAGQRRAPRRRLASYWESGGCRRPEGPSPEGPSHWGAERKRWGRSGFPRCSEGLERSYRWSWSAARCRPWSGRTDLRWTRCWMDRCCLQTHEGNNSVKETDFNQGPQWQDRRSDQDRDYSVQTQLPHLHFLQCKWENGWLCGVMRLEPWHSERGALSKRLHQTSERAEGDQPRNVTSQRDCGDETVLTPRRSVRARSEGDGGWEDLLGDVRVHRRMVVGGEHGCQGCGRETEMDYCPLLPWFFTALGRFPAINISFNGLVIFFCCCVPLLVLVCWSPALSHTAPRNSLTCLRDSELCSVSSG